MKNKYLKSYLQRGALFAGLGPIVAGIVYAIIDAATLNFTLNGNQVLIAIVSTYVLAFVQAGASVFNQIENWPLAKSLACHFSSIYIVYVLCYLVNSWIPFEPMVILIFTAAFVLTYLVIWLSVYFIIKRTTKKYNTSLNNNI